MKIKQIILAFFFLISAFGYAQAEGIVVIDSSPSIDKLINKKINFNNQSRKVEGFRIQLFYGSETSVNNIDAKFRELFPNTTTYVIFDSPDWKIRVGNYKTRLEADKALQRFIVEFGSAIVMPYTINN
ncbi:MAG: SPOR domain-containing protein [Flavobacteriaceae bacterium]